MRLRAFSWFLWKGWSRTIYVFTAKRLLICKEMIQMECWMLAKPCLLIENWVEFVLRDENRYRGARNPGYFLKKLLPLNISIKTQYISSSPDGEHNYYIQNTPPLLHHTQMNIKFEVSTPIYLHHFIFIHLFSIWIS